MKKIPFDNWLSSEGLTLVSYSGNAEFSILNQALNSFIEHQIIFIHSKPIRKGLSENVTLIDVTGHGLTIGSRHRKNVRYQEDVKVIENPAEIPSFLNQLDIISKKHGKVKWWLWCSPSDLVIHGMDEMKLARFIRVIAKDYSDIHFLVLVDRDIHTQRGFDLLKHVAEVHLQTERLTDRLCRWEVVKHQDHLMEGETVEL